MIIEASVKDCGAWDSFVQGHTGHSVYHSWGWKEVIEKSFSHVSHYLMHVENHEVTGIFPLIEMRHSWFGKFLISLPFLNGGGPLTVSESGVAPLLDRAVEILRERNLDFVEIRGAESLHEPWMERRHKVAFQLSLHSDSDLVWKLLKDKVRNEIRKAEKNGCFFREGAHFLGDFYRVFSQNMRDLGTPVYSKRFFENILRVFPNQTRVFAVEYQGKMIAAGLTLAEGQTLEIPWASSLYVYRSTCANMYLYWKIIEWACTHGFKTFDFGRSSPDTGPYHFKKQWGGKEIPLTWHYYLNRATSLPDFNPRSKKYRLAVSLWKKMPLWAANGLGPHIVRSIP